MSVRRRDPAYYSYRLRRLREEFGGRCGDCGSTLALEFAHQEPTFLKGRGRGLPQRVHDISRHRENYKLLCRLCHMAHDYDGRDPWAPSNNSRRCRFEESKIETAPARPMAHCRTPLHPQSLERCPPLRGRVRCVQLELRFRT